MQVLYYFEAFKSPPPFSIPTILRVSRNLSIRVALTPNYFPQTHYFNMHRNLLLQHALMHRNLADNYGGTQSLAFEDSAQDARCDRR